MTIYKYLILIIININRNYYFFRDIYVLIVLEKENYFNEEIKNYGVILKSRNVI